MVCVCVVCVVCVCVWCVCVVCGVCVVCVCTYQQVSGDEDSAGAGTELSHDQISPSGPCLRAGRQNRNMENIKNRNRQSTPN